MTFLYDNVKRLGRMKVCLFGPTDKNVLLRFLVKIGERQIHEGKFTETLHTSSVQQDLIIFQENPILSYLNLINLLICLS